jgi:hypothetical protein
MQGCLTLARRSEKLRTSGFLPDKLPVLTTFTKSKATTARYLGRQYLHHGFLQIREVRLDLDTDLPNGIVFKVALQMNPAAAGPCRSAGCGAAR